MALTETVPLSEAVTVGKEVCRELVLTEVTAAHVIEAQEESEKVVMTKDGPALVSSPALVGLNILRRQVTSIGKVKGPVDIAILKRLTGSDFARVQEAAEKLDVLAATKAVETLQGLGDRGRTGEQGSGD